MKKKKDVFEELKKFIGKYIPILSDIELSSLESELRVKRWEKGNSEKSEEGREKEFFSEYGYECAVFQSNAQDRDDGEECSYYARIIESIILSSDNFREYKAILSIGAGFALAEIFAAKHLFPNSRVVCLDFSEKICKTSKEIAEKEKATNLEFIMGDAQCLPFKVQSFDQIWLFGELSFDRHSTHYKQTIAQFIEPTKGRIISVSY